MVSANRQDNTVAFISAFPSAFGWWFSRLVRSLVVPSFQINMVMKPIYGPRCKLFRYCVGYLGSINQFMVMTGGGGGAEAVFRETPPTKKQIHGQIDKVCRCRFQRSPGITRQINHRVLSACHVRAKFQPTVPSGNFIVSLSLSFCGTQKNFSPASYEVSKSCSLNSVRLCSTFE